MKRKYICLDHGKTLLRGYNIGSYPIHHFFYKENFSPEDPLYPIQISLAGDDEWIAGCYRHRANSDVFAIEFVQQGIFVFTQDGRKVKAGPGEIFLVHLGAETEMAIEGDYAMKRTLVFAGPLLPGCVDLLGLNGVNLVAPCAEDRIVISAFFDRIYAQCRLNDAASYHETAMQSYGLLVKLSAISRSSAYPQQLRQVLEFIHENLNERLNVEMMCRQAGISPATLHRMFIKYLKERPIDYFLRLKMARAADLIERKTGSIKEIANVMGFSSPQYFSTEFRKRYGVTPKNYSRTELHKYG